MNLKNIFLTLILIFSVCVTSYAKTPKQNYNTADIFINASSADVKSMFIVECIKYGYTVEKETDNTVELSRALSGMEDVGVGLGLGNAYSNNRRYVSAVIVKEGTGCHIYLTQSYRVQMPGGQVRQTNIANKKSYAGSLAILSTIKSKLEAK